MAYVKTRGMSGMRSGLGGGQMVDGVYVMDTPITTVTVLPSGENIYQDSTGAVISAGGGSLTDWLNQNSGKVAIGAAAFFGLMLFAKAGR